MKMETFSAFAVAAASSKQRQNHEPAQNLYLTDFRSPLTFPAVQIECKKHRHKHL